MLLRSKIALILSVVIVLYTGMNYGIQHWIIVPSFVSLEREEAKKDMQRCVQAIQREIHHLSSLCHDWAAWDDTYDFISDKNEDYKESNLILESFTDNHLNLIYLIDTKGTVVWGEIRDLETEDTIKVSDFPISQAWHTDHPLLTFNTGGNPLEDVAIDGVMMTQGGPMLITSRPILTSENEGPIKGALVMGRFLNSDVVETLADQTRVNFRLWPTQSKVIPPDDRMILTQITRDNPYAIRESSAEMLDVFTTFRDIQDKDALLLKADIPREITAKGATTVQFATWSIVTAGLLVLVGLLVLLGKVVVKPLSTLTRHATSVGEKDDLTARISMPSQDEIGELARQFDRMVERLAEARRKLVEQSYHSGKAEMASGILHNVRNSLIPVVESVDILRERFLQASTEKLGEALTELQDDSTADERREKLARYVQLSAGNLLSIIQEGTGDLSVVTKQIAFIEEMLGEQDQFSHKEQVVELFKLDEVVREAIDLLPMSADQEISVETDSDMQQLPSVKAERVLLKQIFLNLLTNSADSIIRSGNSPGLIEIHAMTEKTDGVEAVHVQVRDNGEGIAADDLSRIFERGFTNEKGGHSGIGLHWCANILRTMNGRIWAESEGVGRGACVHLRFPINSEAPTHD